MTTIAKYRDMMDERRDQFAMAALTGMVANPEIYTNAGNENFNKLSDYFIEQAYDYADKMMDIKRKRPIVWDKNNPDRYIIPEK